VRGWNYVERRGTPRWIINIPVGVDYFVLQWTKTGMLNMIAIAMTQMNMKKSGLW
jgi:hypothetical protein